MDFSFTEEQELMVESLTELLQDICPESYQTECDLKHEFPKTAWKALADAGWLKLGIPEEFGGTPCDIMTRIIMAKTIGKYAPCLKMTQHNLAINNIGNFGTAKQKADLIPQLLTGDIPGIGLGLTEPGCGTDAAAIKTKYEKVDGGWLINGQKTFSSGANIVRNIMLCCRNPQVENPYKGMTMFILPTNTPGVKINVLNKCALWTFSTCEVFLDDVFLPDDAILGEENNGFYQMMKSDELERLILEAESVGNAEYAYEVACNYANQRYAFGHAIGEYEMIEEKIAQMYIKIKNMKNFLFESAWKLDNGQSIRIDANLGKVYIMQSEHEVIHEAMQIFAGVGLIMDNPIQRRWRDARVGLFGNEVMTHNGARNILREFAKKAK